MHVGNTDTTLQIQQQLEQQRGQQQGQRQQLPRLGDVSQMLAANEGLNAADILQSQQMQSQQVLAYYWHLYLTNALQQTGGQLPLPCMPGSMLGAAPFQSQIHFQHQQLQEQQHRDGLQQQAQLPMHMQQFPMTAPGLNMDPQQQMLQLQQLQQFQQLSQQQSLQQQLQQQQLQQQQLQQQQLQQQQLQQQQQCTSHFQQQQQQQQQTKQVDRELEEMVKRRGDNGASIITAKKPRKIRNENKVCSNCASHSTPFWRKDRNTGLPLCNACGLYYAKNDAMRPKVLWKQDEAATTPPASLKHSRLQPAPPPCLASGTSVTPTDPSTSSAIPASIQLLADEVAADSLKADAAAANRQQPDLIDASPRLPSVRSSGILSPITRHAASSPCHSMLTPSS